MDGTRERCDRCRKWVQECSLVTLPEELYPHLEADNEFAICMKCADKYSNDEWLVWMSIARNKYGSQ